ncbi:MAG TPA: hypothetical protein VN756_06760, partial [Solirubrobacterales bacterium]|nr:hypothetical protein [Solirubrobacterales bacterium]
MRSHAKAATAGSNLRRVGAPRLVFLCVPAFLLFALFAAFAQAAPETVAEFGEKAGQVRGPEGVALNRASGDLYVADNSNHRIDKFDSDGNFLLAWGFGVADGTTPELQT